MQIIIKIIIIFPCGVEKYEEWVKFDIFAFSFTSHNINKEDQQGEGGRGWFSERVSHGFIMKIILVTTIHLL